MDERIDERMDGVRSGVSRGDARLLIALDLYCILSKHAISSSTGIVVAWWWSFFATNHRHLPEEGPIIRCEACQLTAT